MKKIVSALLIVFTTAGAAFAMPPPRYHHHVHYHHEYRRPIYYHNSSDSTGWFLGGLGAGILLTAILSNNSSNSQPHHTQAEREKEQIAAKAAQIRSAAKQTASLQSSQLMTQISQSGAENALKNMENYWKGQSHPTYLDLSRPVSVLKVSGFQDDLNIVYTVNADMGSATVTVNALNFDVSESVSAQFAVSSAPQEMQKSGAQIAGFSVSEGVRNVEGFLIVQEVAKASAAAYAGLKPGSVMRKIDGNSTAAASVEQLWSYIKRRAETNSIINITFANGGGKAKTVQIRL
ncbi:MAG: hypothetical protein Q4E17_04920 [Synergistes sp.]|nr:hypothetical protein [Synergistes sp.]